MIIKSWGTWARWIQHISSLQVQCCNHDSYCWDWRELWRPGYEARKGFHYNRILVILQYTLHSQCCTALYSWPCAILHFKCNLFLYYISLECSTVMWLWTHWNSTLSAGGLPAESHLMTSHLQQSHSRWGCSSRSPSSCGLSPSDIVSHCMNTGNEWSPDGHDHVCIVALVPVCTKRLHPVHWLPHQGQTSPTDL